MRDEIVCGKIRMRIVQEKKNLKILARGKSSKSDLMVGKKKKNFFFKN